MPINTKRILELFSQPAFLAREQTVLWCNAAARALVHEGTPLAEIMEERDTLFSLWSHEGVAQLTVFLQGRVYEASVKQQDDCLLFVLSARDAQLEASASSVLNASASLRKPLHILLNAANELFEKIDVSQAKDAASQVNRAIYQIMRLCGQMSDGSRLLLQRMQVQRRPTDVQKFFDHFVSQVKPLIEASGRNMEYAPLTQNVKADMDTALMERALLNLISNALAYTPSGGTIKLSLQTQGKRLIVAISDNGEGISGDILAGVTARAQNLGGDCRWGLGYGLPMVRQIAREHDGSLMVAANENGEGTTAMFTVSLEPTALSLHSPILPFDYCSGLNHALVELSDTLGRELYDPSEI